MKKKFLALVLTLAMVLSLVPVTALAVGENGPVKTVQSDGTNGVKVIKTATPKEDGNGKATINMEAYVTGTVTTTTQSTPLDIVLVLDQSGSMEDNLDQLKTAATNFINTITADATEHEVNHRIAVVGFASGKNDSYKNTELFVGKTQYKYNKLNEANYKEAFQTVTNKNGELNLTQSINKLDAEGGTHPELGMAMANNIFGTNSDENGTRQRIVVMFTDGEPGDYEFDDAVANATVAQAYETKHTYGATVYTVGLIPNPGDNVEKFLNAVSSNYPDAQDYKGPHSYSPVYAGQLDKNSKYYVKSGNSYKEVHYYEAQLIESVSGWYSGSKEYTPKTDANDTNKKHTQFYSRQELDAQYDKYYMHTGNADELNNIFSNIAQETTTAKVEVKATSEMRDELSNFFVFDGIERNDDGTVTSGVTVTKVAAQGSGSEPAWASEGTEITKDVTVKVVGDKITVTGFDYSSGENCVVKKTGTGWQGHKLVLSFKVEPNVNCHDWTETKNYDTNKTTAGSQAGLYYGDSGSTVLNQSPQVPVPTYQVIYDWDTIENATTVTDNQHYINGQKATVDYTTVQKGTAVKGSNDKLYRFSGWSENGTDIVDKVGITNYNVTLKPVLTEAYTVTYTDGVENEEVFADQVHSNLINGDRTPDFNGTPTRNGYQFTGWEPAVAGTVTGNAIYTARWEKIVEGEVVVTITGKNNTVQYDGTEKSVSGYDVTITKDGEAYTEYTTQDFTFSGTAEATGTDVKEGGYSMGLKVADFKNTNSQFTNVTFVVVDGKLTIQPRTVTMTSGDATKPWDDTALTNDTVTVTGDGFVEGEGANYTVTGSQTDVGESDNTFTYTLNDNTKADNYKITSVFGKLTITEKAEVPYTLIFDANGGVWNIGEISGYTLNTDKNQATKSGLAASYRVDTSTVAEPKKENATFLGWGTRTECFSNLALKPTVAVLKKWLNPENEGNTVTLYAVWKTEETPNPTGQCTYTIRQHYWKNLNDNDTDTGDNVSIKNLTAKNDEKIARLIDGKDKDQDWRGYRYLYDNQQTTVTVPNQEPTKLTGDAVLSVSGTVIDLYYYLDSWKDVDTQNPAGKDEKTGGDGTPDYKQILIEYKAHTPLVGEVNREFEIQTLKDNQTVATPTGAKATAKENAAYAFAYWIKGEVDPEKNEAEIENTAICYKNQLSGVTINPVTRGGTYTYTAVFLKDVTGKIEEGKDKPDGIPDAWQCKVTFKVVNGNWNNNTNQDIVTYVTKKNAEGNSSTNGTAKLTTDQIPPVGNQPNSGYQTSGNWDKTPSAVEITKDTVFTYTYDKKSGGSGGSGGSHKPTVTIPDDVPTGLNGKDHYAYVVGYPDGMVYPQKNITRAEVATIFFRLLTDETREANMTKSNGYNDMKDGAWYTCAVSTLSKMGIIKGYEDGSFKPDASISRAEFAAIAARFDPDGDKTPATFSDVSSHWAKDEISIAANHGWIKGYEDGSFKPDQKITRAETMTLVNRVLKRLPETKDDLHKDMKTWPDNQKESAWFYLAVQEATNSHYQKLKKDGTHETWESMRETRDWAALEK